MDKSTEGCIEINQTIYECDRDLAELLEWLRLEEVRVKIYKSVKSKPYVGYIRQRKRRIPGGGTISRPVIVYNRRCYTARWVHEDVLAQIYFANKSMGEDPIWTAFRGVQIEFELPLVQVGDP